MRPTLNQYLLTLAQAASTRATCAKRQVGAVVADAQGRIVATGYNGPPSGFKHCTEHPCPGALEAAAPASHAYCNAIHAEQNALLLAGEKARGGTIAVTTSPCKACTLMIINAGIQLVLFTEQNRLFADKASHGTSPEALLKQAGVAYQQL